MQENFLSCLLKLQQVLQNHGSNLITATEGIEKVQKWAVFEFQEEYQSFNGLINMKINAASKKDLNAEILEKENILTWI